MKIRTYKNRIQALTLVELLTVVAFLIMLAVVFLPQLARPRRAYRSSRISCVNALKQVGLAFRIWQADNNDKFPMSISTTNGGTMELNESGTVWRHFEVMSNELNTPKILFCPADTDSRRRLATVWGGALNESSGQIPFTGDTNTSYFIGVDADYTNPNMFLAGDRNLMVKNVALKPGLHLLTTNEVVGWTAKLHVNQGNVLMADASVQQFTSASLPEALIKTGVATNRLSLP